MGTIKFASDRSGEPWDLIRQMTGLKVYFMNDEVSSYCYLHGTIISTRM